MGWRARLDSWPVHYCGADPTTLNQAIGRKTLVAAVRRVRSPGCKFDYITVLESICQGIGKSTMLKILAGEDNFSDAEIIGAEKRDQQESVQGIWIYEIGELEGMYKSDVRKVKQFASKTVDSARPAYGRNRIDRPRRCIFIATTNEQNYLRDTTGNRRFWPVELHGVIPAKSGLMMIDLDGIERDRDQLWAEAAMVEATGEGLVIGQDLWSAVGVQQLARMETDPWIDILADQLATVEGRTREGFFAVAADEKGDPETRVASDYLLSRVLEVPKERQNNNHTKRLVEAMRVLGWRLSPSTIRIGKSATRGYRKPLIGE
jgi:predicted P-loop ATPase